MRDITVTSGVGEIENDFVLIQFINTPTRARLDTRCDDRRENRVTVHQCDMCGAKTGATTDTTCDENVIVLKIIASPITLANVVALIYFDNEQIVFLITKATSRAICSIFYLVNNFQQSRSIHPMLFQC